MMTKRMLYAALGVGGVVLIALTLRPRPVPVEVGIVSRGPLRVTLDEEGKTEVRRRYQISTPLAGQLLRLTVEAGDPVKEGTVVASLLATEAPLLDARARAEEQARKRAAEASLAQAQANVSQAELAAHSAADDLARKQKLAQRSAISAHELELARSEAASRTEALAAARFGAKVAAQKLSEARAALSREANGASQAFAIHAPAAGQILRVERRSAGVVAAGTPLVEVGDPTALEVTVELLTADAAQVRPGMAAFIDHWGGPTLAARVRSIDPSGFTKLSALGVEEQRVRVILDLATAATEPASLGDHFHVEAHIVVWGADSVLRVPSPALFHRNDGWAVYVIEGHYVHLREVELGHQTPELVEVKRGLRPGEKVVLRPGEGLREGVDVVASK